MRHKSGTPKGSAEKVVKDIRRKTRRQFSAEEKIRIVLEGLRGEISIAELCRREGIATSLYYSWSKEFLEAGKKQLAGDTTRQANAALYRVAIVRMRSHEPTLAYVKKRTKDGKSKSEIIRCLKRYIVREIYRQLCVPKSPQKAA